jgi:predicted  nucleic acid-binding Zn-ribbon protein
LIDAFNKAVNDMDEAVLDLMVQVSAAKKKLKEYQDGKDLDAAKIAKLEGEIRDLTLKMQSTSGLLDGTFIASATAKLQQDISSMRVDIDDLKKTLSALHKIETQSRYS